MTGAKPAKPPCLSDSQLSRLDGDSLFDAFEYRSVVGALQYCTLTQPDTTFSMNQLCQRMHHLTTSHCSKGK
jgi:hypothetical protein